MTVTVSYLQQAGYTGAQERMARAGLLTKSGAANKARTGILPFNGAELLPGPNSPTPDMHTLVTPGVAIIPDSAGGAHELVNDATVTLTHAAANATNPRTDLIIARVYDNEAGDTAATGPMTLPGSAGSVNVQSVTGTIEIVQGVAGPGAPVPALPNVPAGARCIVLAQVTVRASATNIVAGDIATTAAIGRPGKTVAAGGVLPVLTAAEIAGLPQHEGQLFDAADTDQVFRSNGATASVLADPSVFTAWSAYSPALTASTTNPTMGASTLVGRFKQIGKTVFFQLRLTIGSGFAAGTGFYKFSLPVAANATSWAPEQVSMTGLVQQGSNRRACIGDMFDANTFFLIRNSTEALVDSTGAGSAWASGNILTASGFYEAA